MSCTGQAGSVELVGFIIDASKSMFYPLDTTVPIGEVTLSNPTKFAIATHTVARFLERLNASGYSNRYYLSGVIFSNEAALLPPIEELNLRYVKADDSDNIKKIVEKLRNETSKYSFNDIKTRFSRDGSTNYAAGLNKALEISTDFVVEASQDSDCSMISRFLITDGCHTNVFEAPKEKIKSIIDDLQAIESLVSTSIDPSFEIESKVAIVLVGNRRKFLGCSRAICEIAPDLEDAVRERLKRLGLDASSPNSIQFDRCSDKNVFYISERSDKFLEGLRSIVRIVTGTVTTRGVTR